MAKIIDGYNVFNNYNVSNNQAKALEDKLEYYRNFLLLYAQLETQGDYFLTFHNGLNSDEEFVEIYCPHCGTILNEETMNNQKIWVHGKVNVDTDDLNDRRNWGIVEVICPECHQKDVIILE